MPASEDIIDVIARMGAEFRHLGLSPPSVILLKNRVLAGFEANPATSIGVGPLFSKMGLWNFIHCCATALSLSTR